jgi:hypothetical protein
MMIDQASPFTPQVKHLNAPSSVLTEADLVRSGWWNGHRMDAHPARSGTLVAP